MTSSHGRLSFTELFELPVVIDLRTAARALGVCNATAYRLVHRGEFPCMVLRVGRQFRVPTSQLMRALGIEERPLYDLDPDPDVDQDPDAEPDSDGDRWRTGS
ncbi:helix-turn-helix domain-containing protein [Streptomyces sp. NPDC004610]|uniref:helix-turn-helix domain-containing protein n=1 Tax=unclassified Streptomyces TaxID=2593676 RepID=UPI0033A24E09